MIIWYICDMKLVFATANLHKVKEASQILGPGFELSIPADYGHPEDIPETGNTLEANSLQKATYVYDAIGMDCFADDSGLEVDALDGAPGVYTARYAHGDSRFKDNLDKLLYVLDGQTDRRARFHTVVTLIIDGKPIQFQGYCEGSIGLKRIGTGGFGYDPIFIPAQIPVFEADGSWNLVPNSEGLAMAQLPDGAKNYISHRGRSLRIMAEYLATLVK